MTMKDHIHEFWESQGKQYNVSHEASWGDGHAIALEVETLAKHIKDGDTVLDVGCANGYSAIRQLEHHRLAKLIGIDFSAAMIEAAGRAKTEHNLEDTVEFRVGDVRELEFPDRTFDVVYTTRVLINLPTWDEQMTGIRECLRVARPGGKVILSEGFWEPLMLLNAMRALCGLPPLVEHDFNRYLKKERLEQMLRSLKLDFMVEEFSSIYYLGSRLLRELVTDPTQYPGYTNPINELFYNIEKDYSGGGFGIQQAYVVSLS